MKRKRVQPSAFSLEAHVVARIPAANEPPFGRVRDAFSGSFGLAAAGKPMVLAVDRGRIALAASSTLPEFLIEGETTDWQRIATGDVSFFEAINPVLGTMKVLGNPESMFRDMGGLAEIVGRLFPRQGGQATDGGVDKTPDKFWGADTITGRYLKVDGTPVFYESAGSVDRPAVLCLHTAGGESRQWHGVMNYLAGDYHIVAFDLPGHGKSWPLEGNRCIDTPASYADITSRFIQSYGLKRPVIIGCSMGGNVALMLASQIGPSLAGVVALQGADYTPTTTQTALKFMNHPHVQLADMSEAQTRSLIGAAACNAGRDLVWWQIRQRTPDAFQSDMALYTQFDIRNVMASIKCPVLLARGDSDWLVPERMVRETQARIEGASFVSITGVGHFAPAEAPQLVTEAITPFLQSVFREADMADPGGAK